MSRSATPVAMLLLLSGCGFADLPAVQQNPAPANEYRRIVSQSGAMSGLRSRPELAYFEIAGLRPAVAPQPGEWMTCLRAMETTKAGSRPAYFGVFLRQWTVVELRRGVLIDRCEQEQYSELSLYPAAKSD